MVCIRCQKRPAIIFVQRMENGQMKNEGYCLHCAREMHIKPVDDLMKQFGMSDEDMDAMEDRMENMMQEMGDMSNMNPFSMMMGMGQPDQSEEDGDLVPGSSATFPLGVNGGAQNGKNEKKTGKNEKKPPRRKFLDTYCENLTRKAREGKLDDIIGRDREIYRTIQILSRRQKNNPCLIGEAGVGKTAIAEGIAERIAKGQVPAGLQDKEIFLLDLTSLVAGTQFRGQFEQRVKGLLSEVKAAPAALFKVCQCVSLFINNLRDFCRHLLCFFLCHAPGNVPGCVVKVHCAVCVGFCGTLRHIVRCNCHFLCCCHWRRGVNHYRCSWCGCECFQWFCGVAFFLSGFHGIVCRLCNGFQLVFCDIQPGFISNLLQLLHNCRHLLFPGLILFELFCPFHKLCCPL